VSDALMARLARDLDRHFEAFVVAHQDGVYGAALRLTGCRQDAEEVAQDAFVRAHRALSAYDAERVAELRPRPWLAQIVLNLCRNRARDRSRRPTTTAAIGAIGEGVAFPTDGSSPEGMVLEREAGDEWAARLAALPDPSRAAIVLRHVVGLPYADVADVLQVPVGTAKARVHRAVAQLRERYQVDLDQEDER
jgi:RNA polymerase sigma-70 factor (ECF subfamily)